MPVTRTLPFSERCLFRLKALPSHAAMAFQSDVCTEVPSAVSTVGTSSLTAKHCIKKGNRRVCDEYLRLRPLYSKAISPLPKAQSSPILRWQFHSIGNRYSWERVLVQVRCSPPGLHANRRPGHTRCRCFESKSLWWIDGAWPADSGMGLLVSMDVD